VSRQREFINRIKDNEGIIFKVSRLYCDREEDRHDLYQEIIYQLWRSYASFRGDSKWSTWMYRVSLNTAIANLRKNQKGFTPGNSEVLENLREENYDPVIEDRINWLYKEIEELSVVEKAIVLLYLEGRSHEEISEITGFSKSNVGTRIGRIKNKLRDKLKK
jgi:RNA polymerase sigma-70 factor (ECF subfamily)